LLTFNEKLQPFVTFFFFHYNSKIVSGNFIIIGFKMLKKPYLKHFVFFLPLLSYGFDSYGMIRTDDLEDRHSNVNLKRVLRQLEYNGYNNDGVKVDTPFWSVIELGVKQGAAQASLKEALRVISRLLEIIPYSVNKGISMIKIYWYKMAFGTTGLTVRDLTKFSNRIHSLCIPLASAQTGNLRKTKRATVIEGEQTNGEVVDIKWLERRQLLVSELEHVIAFLKNVLPCYSSAFQSIDASIFEKNMANVLYAISTENNKEIQHYIICLIGYVNDLITLLESFNSFDNAVEHSEDTKTLLNIIRLTFEHTSSFLTDATVKGSSGFQKMNDDVRDSKRDIMDLLGNGR